MKRFRSLGTRQRLLAAFVVAAAVFGLVSVVQASIPDSNGVIHGCYKNTTGALRVLTSGKCSKTDETALNWNQGQSEYAYLYSISPSDIPATVAPGADVPLAQNGLMTAGITNLNGQVTISTAGVYRVQFLASVTEDGQLVLTKNGIELPSTLYGRATGTSEISGQAILAVAAGDVLTLRNPSGNSHALTFTPNAGGTHPDVSASIVIEKLG